LLDKTGTKIRAIIPVHLFGLCCEIDSIQSIARNHGLHLIEDAAQAIGVECRIANSTAKAGTIGAIGCFSFYPTKNLGAGGDAGLIVCTDADLAKRLRIIRHQGMEPRYHHQVIGGNFRLDEIQAAILNAKLSHLKKWLEARRSAADFYGEEFERQNLINRVTLPVDPNRKSGLLSHVYHQYVIRALQRDALREHLTKREIGTEIYYPIGLHMQKCFAQLGYKEGDLPATERAARDTVALPIYPEISRESQRYVVDAIAEFFR
jgi:dTDP-4-amino-4,6-dideoxygalactose transaminase